MVMYALLLPTGHSSFLSSSFPTVHSSIFIPNWRGDDAGIDKRRELESVAESYLQKTKKDLSRDRTCQISIMRILARISQRKNEMMFWQQ
jgi:hypothetical protein